MRPRDIVRDSHSHSRCSTVSLPLRHLLHKEFINSMQMTIQAKMSCEQTNNNGQQLPAHAQQFRSPALLRPFGVLAVFTKLLALCVFPFHPVPDCSLDHTIWQAKYGLGSSKWSVCTLLCLFGSPLIAQDALAPTPFELNCVSLVLRGIPGIQEPTQTLNNIIYCSAISRWTKCQHN